MENTESLKGVSENPAAKKGAPLKEVWWGSLNALGKNAAFAEVFGVDPRAAWVSSADVLLAFCRVRKMQVELRLTQGGAVMANVLTVGAGGGAVMALAATSEALCVALLRWAGVVVYLQKKPLGAQGDAGVTRSDAGVGGCDVHRTASSGGGL